MKLIFLGPPGAGKGTMAVKTRELLGVPHISTGELFRENVARQTELGLEVKKTLEQGNLVPDEITVAMVEKRLSETDAAEGFILDGFPRTIPQAEALSAISSINHVLNLSCPDEELVKRLTGRRFCPTCSKTYHVDFIPPKVEGHCDDDGTELLIREDDTIDAVTNRLNVYAEATKPLISWYREHKLLRNIDANAAPDTVFAGIREFLGL